MKGQCLDMSLCGVSPAALICPLCCCVQVPSGSFCGNSRCCFSVSVWQQGGGGDPLKGSLCELWSDPSDSSVSDRCMWNEKQAVVLKKKCFECSLGLGIIAVLTQRNTFF